MIGAASFLPPLGERPPQYRTPSPPRRAVEPITPSTAEFRAAAHPIMLGMLDRMALLIIDRVTAGRTRPLILLRPSLSQRAQPSRHSPIAHLLRTLDRPSLCSPPESNNSERPAKRPRSERDPSPYLARVQPPAHSHSHSQPPSHAYSQPRSHNHSYSNVLPQDSMTTDAELLLNFARPTNFHPGNHTKRVSIDESYHHYGNDASRHNRVGFATESYHDGKPAYHMEDGHPPSRMRSRSDGSAFVPRPVIRGVRPTTSSGTLSPIVWEDENEESSSGDASRYTGYGDHMIAGPKEPYTMKKGVASLPKLEEEEPNESNQTSCGACHMVRTPMETEENEEDTWINCDGCKQWFHIVCAGFKNDREVRTVDKFICHPCRPVYGQTTFVRKSSRARTAIDYAGLNQGLVKAASNSLEHHYLEPIRQGRIKFLPENFPRMKPELVVAEYFERGNGWTEPVVIPACWNTREPVSEMDAGLDALAQEATTQEMFDELLEHLEEQEADTKEVIDCGQDQLDMVIPQGLTVRAVAELYGPEERVEVIDVKSQQGEDKRWNMQKWADYYESNEPEKPVRNVISLEVSQSRLGRLIKRPKIVRDLDLQDAVWPEELKAIGDYPKVQFYCLMSVADCYTDFHIDFGGSSVYYHILKGKKTFFFIPPTDRNLKKYEEWCNSPAQDSVFLGNQTKECYRVDLSEGDTMLIPSGWIHAVWTPENSLVIGGNFLTRLNYGMQIKILNIEKDTKVPKKFRYPFFQKIQWYTAMRYLEEDPVPQNVVDAFMQDENFRFHRDYPAYYEFGELTNREPLGSPFYNARFYSQAELEGLPELAKYLLRTALIASSYLVDGVTNETRNAVRRSIPKGVTDPVDMIRIFGIWVAWKRGNETAARWTRPGVIESNPKVSLNEKKPAGRSSRRSDRHADSHRTYAERQAVQRPAEDLAPTPVPPANNGPHIPFNNATPMPANYMPEYAPPQDCMIMKPRSAPRGSGLGPKRVACDACRRRRIRCRHKDEPADQQMGINGFGSASGVSTPNSLAQDAVSALNSLAAIASQAGFQSNGMIGLDAFDGSGKFQSAIMGASTAAANRLNDLSPDGANGAKKGRSKACDDCRKSKRRCIHDEYGQIDPIKANERSKPRGTASAKRPRPNEDDSAPTSSKKTKQESTSPVVNNGKFGPTEGQADTKDSVMHAVPATYDNEVANHRPPIPRQYDQIPLQYHQPRVDDQISVNQTYASPPVFQADLDMKDSNSLSVSSKPTTSLVSPPTSLADEMDVVQDGEAMASVEGEAPNALHTPNSSSRHSSRQPRHVERFVPEATSARPSKPPGRTALPTSRTTPGHQTGHQSSAKKPSSRPSSSHAKKSSPMIEKRFERHATTSLSPHQPKHVNHQTEEEEQSLRLIRELQEAEFGLRRRRG
ncbi:hypothetical protein N7532_003353 [Penicillium argentinense]|uniref:JmjC domain-containing histone demethylation protein 1 n=1 Tax=Penicillium argentinense TaxID=1131581 RepID=A0A9W9KDX0_9EURO|nr:uncharacterized protein N7532_003353 [Penicillium argentinense]KAJ5102824.1 hypothetical protein N7532_003353 [Penicillium argentinense]